MKDNDAILSADHRYRYVLSRRVPYVWARSPRPPSPEDERICLWVMVNPSTADASKDDHTIRKVIGYCQYWGFPRFRVVNLFAYRAKEIDVLTMNPSGADIVGPDNDTHIYEQAGFASEIIVAWGSRKKMPSRAGTRIPHVMGLLRGSRSGHAIFCIGRTKSGDPKHPLTTPYSAPRVRFED